MWHANRRVFVGVITFLVFLLILFLLVQFMSAVAPGAVSDALWASLRIQELDPDSPRIAPDGIEHRITRCEAENCELAATGVFENPYPVPLTALVGLSLDTCSEGTIVGIFSATLAPGRSTVHFTTASIPEPYYTSSYRDGALRVLEEAEADIVECSLVTIGIIEGSEYAIVQPAVSTPAPVGLLARLRGVEQ